MKQFSLYFRCLILLAAISLSLPAAFAQQTLGGITGEVADASGGVILNAAVTVSERHTSLTRSTKTSASGVYQFVNLPIGDYTITFTADGYQAQKTPSIVV